MSAKWRALQHRHRYTYSSTAFPDYFLEALKELLSDPAASSSKFPAELSHLTSLTTSYAQVATCNELSISFSELLLRDPPAPVHFVSAAARMFLEVLFLENSLPLHRPILSTVAKSRKSLPLLHSCFVELCREYGAGGGKAGKKRFLVSRAALSLLGYPKLGFLDETLRECAVLVALDIAHGMKGVMNDVECGSRPSPAVMEQCQDAMSCLYYLFQRFPSSFACGKECSNVFARVLEATMGVLKSQAFSRDCLVASSVSFWAALQVYVAPEELIAFIARKFFGYSSADQVENSDTKRLLPCNLDLRFGLGNVPPLSRLCLLRGMLTAVPRKLLNTHFEKTENGTNWTVLYNAILPELCRFCEDPIDIHFNFHGLTVLQICLQQIKTSIMTDLTDYSPDSDPFPEGITGRILRIAWNNLEDPLSQTVKQVHLVFDLFLDIQTKFHSGKDEQNKLFLRQIASKLLLLGPRCKGRYVPLASLTRRLGALTLLEMNAKLLFETTQAYVDDDVCCAATSFLKCFLECLRDECWSCYGVNTGYESFRGLCLPPILEGLVSEVSKLRTNLNTYALPVVLDIDEASIFPMLSFIGIRPQGDGVSSHEMVTVNQCVAALVSLLKVSRLLALVEGDIELDHYPETSDNACEKFAIVCVKMIRIKVPVQWLELALTHAEESIRIDAAETLFLNPKTSTLPSKLELCLLRKAVPLNMRCCSTAFQMKWCSMFRKFFSRVKTALERQVKAGGWNPLSFSECGDDRGCGNKKHLASKSAEELIRFMKWFSCHLFFSCYPSAPYERKTMAMELILIMLDVWPVIPPPTGVVLIYPYSHEFTSPDSTLLLVGAIIDSWDRLRESSYHILLRFPTPLPGISCNNSVKEVITWAKMLVGSPRVRESDAGALVLRLIFRKYVLDLGWIVSASAEVSCFVPQHELPNGNIQIIKPRKPVIEYLYSLVNWLQSSVVEGERDLSEACRNSFVHGILLTLRYAFEELDWNSSNVSSSLSEMKSLLEKLLELVTRITSLTLWVVSSDAWHFPDDTDDVMDLLDDINVETCTLESSSDAMSDVSKPTDDVGPRDQIIMVGCWLAMKEVSLLLGTIVRKIPLPSHTDQDLPDAEFFAAENRRIHNSVMSNAVLDLEQLEKLGNHFLQVLLKMKHNGAIDKTRAGFTALCNRLLSSNDPRLCNMVDTWLEILMERTIARGQTVDDLLRRSAGIPAAFIALFLSEPEGTPKKLLPRSLRWLIDVATNSVQTSSKINSPYNAVLMESCFEDFNGKNINPVSKMKSKVRDEGVVPTVHAFNVLRASFNDTNLAADTSGFSAEALIISIRSFSSPYWEVRNSACLAYTALVRRMIGFLNVRKRESARRSLTGIEFFHRYPALHPFLLSELKIATEALSYEQMRSVSANAVHPSLCPILILLSRLKPPLASSDPNDEFDPFIFMPFIQKCAAQNYLRVRMLASKALAGLVSNERLHSVVLTIANCLPGERSRVGEPMGGYSAYECDVNEKSENPSAKTCSTSFNTIHGTLLLLSTLVEKNFSNMTNISMKEKIIGQLMEILLQRSWIASIRKCPCPTLNSSFIYLLGNILDMAQRSNMNKCIVSTRNWLEELSSEYLGKEYSSGLTVYDPTEAELRRQATTFYFSCQFGGSQEVQDSTVYRLQERIVFCLSDSTYEVRLAMLKSILQFLKSPNSNGDFFIQIWSKINLQPILIQSLALESNRKCIYYILRIIFIWNALQSEKPEGLQVQKMASIQTMDRNSLICFWKKLVHLNTIVTHSKTREALLCCMGMCVKQFTQLLRKTFDLHEMEAAAATNSNTSSWAVWPNVYEYLGYFLLLVKKYGSASQPVNLRKSAAESIVASGLLGEADFIAAYVSNNEIPGDQCESEDFDENCPCFISSKAAALYAQKILDAWSTCISFLEDEDVGLRQKLARDINSFMNSRKLNQADHSDVVPTQVENIIESCFDFLFSIFKYWMGYLDYLSGWALDTANSTVLSGDLVRQVFDKEIDNHHEEKLLICQICCLHIERILKYLWPFEPCSDMCRGGIAHLIQRWRSRFLHELTHFTRGHSKSRNENAWVGGIGNHKDVFVPIYGNLLGLFALLQCPHPVLPAPLGVGDKSFSLGFSEIKLLMGPFLKNPLIFNLYHLVVESHEALLGSSETHMDSEFRGVHSLEKEFNPYFLLR